MTDGSKLRRERRASFANVVRQSPVDQVTALTLIAAEAREAGAPGPEVDIVAVLAGLDALADTARPLLAEGRTPAAALERALGVDAGFRGSERDYATAAGSLLPDVLRTRGGLPILLSVVWVEVARRLDVTARCLNTPGHVLAEVGGVVVDPFAGGSAVWAPETDRVAGGNDALPTLADGPLLLRVLTNLRALGSRTGDHVLSLWATELSMLLPSHPLELRRELGAVLVRNGRYAEGARELDAFADIAPPPHDEEARRAAVMARARLN